MGAAVIFMMLCWQIPKLFSAVLGGAPALTGGDLISTGTGLGGGCGGCGSLAAGGVALAARGAAAISGVGAAAGAGGSGAGTSAAGVGAAGRGSGGALEVVSFRRHRRRRPVHPGTADQNSQTHHPEMAVPAVRQRMLLESGSTSSGGSSPVRNGSGQYHGSNGNGPASSSSIASALSSVGGDHLTGSGFEGERSASGFTPSSSPILPRPQFDQASALMLARAPIPQLRSRRLPGPMEHTDHRPRSRRCIRRQSVDHRQQTKAMDLAQARRRAWCRCPVCRERLGVTATARGEP